jgi:hypothetical protein
MIDYFTHVAALQVFLQATTNQPPADDQQFFAESRNDAENEPGAALLGALVDHLLQYAQPQTAAELDTLSGAAALFQRGLTIFGALSDAREKMETALLNPAAHDALANANTARNRLPQLSADSERLREDIQAYQARYSGRWLAPRDVFLARGTTLFLVKAKERAQTAKQRAFTLGALAGAAGNLLGSAYLNAVVGGPRRSHRLRHRLAAYSVGAWLRDNEPLLAGGLDTLRTSLAFGQTGTPVLPAELKGFLADTLHDAYRTGPAPLPDLDLGYRNLLAHLSLLDDFPLPAQPAPLSDKIVKLAMKANAYGGDYAFAEAAAPPPSGLSGNFPGIGAHESADAVCLTILSWAWPPYAYEALKDLFGSSDSGTGEKVDWNAQALTDASHSPPALRDMQTLYGYQTSAWQALSTARTALVLRGLLYPGPEDFLGNSTFQQFVAVPVNLGLYPLLPMPDSDDGTTWPASSPELQPTDASHYDAGTGPLVFLTTHHIYSVFHSSSALWEALIEHPNGQSGQEFWPTGKNYNLDGDRGFQWLCWTTASITSQPVGFTLLDFEEI